MIKIHDIKPILEIPDISIYLYYGLIVFSALLILLIAYFLYKFFKPKAESNEKKYYNVLLNMDFSNPKHAAYTISKYGSKLAKDEKQLKLLEELSLDLIPFKYKKDVNKIMSQDVINKFKQFRDTLNVK